MAFPGEKSPARADGFRKSLRSRGKEVEPRTILEQGIQAEHGDARAPGTFGRASKRTVGDASLARTCPRESRGA